MRLREIWKRSDLAPDYEVSTLGGVRRLTLGNGSHSRTYPGRVCKQHPDKDGYLRVWLVVNGKVKVFSVHGLVANAFIGKCPKGLQVNHKNLDKSECSVTNLEYVTGKQNTRHAILAGVPWGKYRVVSKRVA